MRYRPFLPTWTVAYRHYDPVMEGRREARFALGDGVYTTRAAAPGTELTDAHYPGTYRAGFHHAVESVIEGERVVNESLVNLPNWAGLDARIEGGPWISMDAQPLEAYRHALDMACGVVDRRFAFTDEAGRRTRWRERRAASVAEPGVLALQLLLSPLDWEGEVEFRLRLDPEVRNENVDRYGPWESRHLEPAGAEVAPERLLLRMRTVGDGVEVALAARLRVAGGEEDGPEVIRGAPETRFRRRVRAGETARAELAAVYACSLDERPEPPAERAARRLARTDGFARLREESDAVWRGWWARAGVEAEEEEIARRLRFDAFHIMQTVSPHTREVDAGAPARGRAGEGYRGHVFWDEIFLASFLDHRFPEVSRGLLEYRFRRLDAARRAAREAGLRGAMYPWRSGRDGGEATPRFQWNMLSGRFFRDHTYLQRHIGSAVAYRAWRYVMATGDDGFLADCGAEMIVEIARFWASLAEEGEDGRFHIRGVLGPDEYHDAYPWSDRPGLDDNAYTNIMAAWTLTRAGEALELMPAGARRALEARLELRPGEPARWDRISRRLALHFHEDGVLSQFAGFERLKPFDEEILPEELRDKRLDWALEAVGDRANAYQLTKQADALTAFHLLPTGEAIGLVRRLGYDFDRDALRRTAFYYLQRTVHRSSLSRVVYAGALAELDPELSWSVWREALGVDLTALKGESVAEGVHLGAMGGGLDVLQRRYLGVSAEREVLRLEPLAPDALRGVRLRLRWRDLAFTVSAEAEGVRVEAAEGNARALPLAHGAESVPLSPASGVLLPRRSGQGGTSSSGAMA